jgi:APA family basic amino acid/polyamine antiporter
MPLVWSRITRRKTIAELTRDAESTGLRRTLGRTDLIVLGIGAVIGSGIFVMPGIVASTVAGPAVVISLLIAAVAAMLAGLCYAEFSSLTPVSGSAYTYAYATLGELCAWLIGWGLILEYTLGSATLAIGWGAYVMAFVERTTHMHTTALQLHFAAIFATAAATAILCLGIRRSAYATAVFVLIKLAVIMLFVFFGALFIDPQNWHPFVPAAKAPGVFGWGGVFSGASIMFVAYIGFDAFTTAAQEAKDPKSDEPAGVLGSLGISAVIYAAVALVLVGLVPYNHLKLDNPMGEAIHATGVKWVGIAVELGAIAGLSSVLIVLLLAQARILLAMSRDGLLPKALSAVRPDTGVPFVGTIVTGVVVAILSTMRTVEWISMVISIGTFMAFMIVCIGIPILRHTHPDLPRPFRVPGSPALPLLGALACLSLVLALPPHTWALAGGWFLIGLVIYAVRLATVHASE